MKILVLLSLAASIALASPAGTPDSGVISQDDTGVVVNASLVRHYAELCHQFPDLGVKEGDGVFVIDADTFHLDTKHYLVYLTMQLQEQTSRAQAAAKPQTPTTGSYLAGP